MRARPTSREWCTLPPRGVSTLPPPPHTPLLGRYLVHSGGSSLSLFLHKEYIPSRALHIMYYQVAVHTPSLSFLKEYLTHLVLPLHSLFHQLGTPSLFFLKEYLTHLPLHSLHYQVGTLSLSLSFRSFK